jgi:hypothetical protein
VQTNPPGPPFNSIACPPGRGEKGGPLYVWCERGRDDLLIRAELGRPLSTSPHHHPGPAPVPVPRRGARQGAKGLCAPAALGDPGAGYAAPPQLDSVRLHGGRPQAPQGIGQRDQRLSLRAGVRPVRIRQDPNEDEHVYINAKGFSALNAVAETVAREVLEVGEAMRGFFKASPNLEALMRADAAELARADGSQEAA